MSDAIEAAAKALISAQRDMFRGGGWFALDDAKTLVSAALTAYEAAKGGGVGNAKDEIVTRILDMALVGHALSDRTDIEADLFVDELRSLVTDVFVNNGLYAHPKPDGSALTSPASGAEYRPMILHLGVEAGDPYWQFVERDVPAVTGQVFAANVEMLTDYDGNLVGFNIFEPSPASGRRDAVIEVTVAMIEAGAVAIDALWSEDDINSPPFSELGREYQAHCRSTACAALVAALRMEGK